MTSSSSRFMISPWKKPAKLDDVRLNGWLDAMISSSPPRKKLVKDFNVEVAPEDDYAQLAWMVIISFLNMYINFLEFHQSSSLIS